MSTETVNGSNGTSSVPKKILINAFDMSTVGHLSPGQWKNPKDKSATKRKLDYWINLAKLLEKGGINALFLADTYGGYDTYEGSLDNCIRRAAQWPMTDPTIVRCNNSRRTIKVLIKTANICNGSGDEASQLRNHRINIV
jgi:alkanesulfonate monooxygenase SsuD/methylene tetrahydromethanopterin reductase-like flavin-dependent oxidoreductase (luciferase family)